MSTETMAARRYLAAHHQQNGTSSPVGCPMAQAIHLLPIWAFSGLPSGLSWIEAGRLAALAVLAPEPCHTEEPAAP